MVAAISQGGMTVLLQRLGVSEDWASPIVHRAKISRNSETVAADGRRMSERLLAVSAARVGVAGGRVQ